MKFSALPEDILVRICHFAVGASKVNAELLKNQIWLLSVCESLRRAALPLVYKTAYFYCVSPNNSNTGMKNRGIEKVSIDTLMTNAHLLKSTKMFDQVKTVHITIQANYYSVTSLHLICSEMEKCLKQWPNVIELNLCFGFNYFSRLRADRNINRYQASMQPYVKTIGELLPRVSKLVLQGATQCEVLDEWFGDLALHYSNQLRYLDRDYCIVIDTPPLQTFNMLTNLNVTFGEFANYSTACAAASQLQQLRIYNIPCSVDESLPAVKPTTIVFPELRYLLLEYPRASNVFANIKAHASLPKLKLPCLETLHILFGGNYCPVLACAVLPTSMKSINIIGQYGILSVLDKCGVQRVEKLMMTALLNPTNNASDTKNLIKSLYDCNRVTRYGCLRLDKTLTLKPEDLETLTITHLQIGMEMDSVMVIAFITKLSRLVDIKFTNVSMEDSVLNLAGPAINGDIGKTVVPFAAPINSLSVNYNNNRDSTQPVPELITYLLLRLPMLRYLTANKVSAEDITKHVEQFEPHFPHLSHISFDLEECPPFVVKGRKGV